MASDCFYDEYKDLRRFIWWLVVSAFPMATFTLGVGFASNSLSVLTAALDTILTVSVNIVNLVTLGIIMRQNVFKYPYGTGKLENFVGVVYGCFITPVAISILIAAANRYWHPPQTVDLGLSQVAMLVNLARTAAFYAWIRRLTKKYPVHSPLTEACNLDYLAAVIYETALVFCLFLGWLASILEAPKAAVWADMIIASVVALYILVNGLKLIYGNFHALICLPLPESDQCKILNALVQEFEEYDGVGNIYTQRSGRQRFIQIELHFAANTTVESVERLRERLERRLGESFPELRFHLIPLCAKQEPSAPSSTEATPAS